MFWCLAVAVVFGGTLAGCSRAVFSEPEAGTADGPSASAGDPPVLNLEGVPASPSTSTPAAPAQENPLRGAKPSTGGTGEAPKAVAAEPGKGKQGKEPFDPIRRNGEFFVGWPKPRLALVITGRTDGYFEPCGCAGLDRMKGGLSRRHSMLEELRRRKGWPVVALDVGGLIKGFGKQTDLKFQSLVSAMDKMGYDAIGLGKGELKLSTAELVSYVAKVENRESPFLSANVGLYGFDSGITPQKRVIAVGGLKLGVTSVLGKKYQAEINNTEVEMSDPQAALAKVVPQLQREQCDLLVLLAHATLEESKELAEKFPQFDVVVTADGPPEPPEKLQVVGRKTLLIEVGEKGMNAIVLGLFDDPRQRFRYQRVILDSRYPASPEITHFMGYYQDHLKTLGFAGLGIEPVPHPQADVLGKFVGSQKCESCHEESYKVWKKSGHARAYDALVKASPPRNFDPECLSCHVIGWYPPEHTPYKSGFISKERTPQLTDVGCESCHGPGGAHVDAEMGSNKALKEKLQKAAVVTKAEAEKRLCFVCHDLDNSPDFDFPGYWPKVEHREAK
jgi:hypothetical protein